MIMRFVNDCPLIVKLPGHLERLFHRHEGWNVHDELSDKYPAVSRISGMFNVRPHKCHSFTSLTWTLHRGVCYTSSTPRRCRALSLRTNNITKSLPSASRMNSTPVVSGECYLIKFIRMNRLLFGYGLLSTLGSSSLHISFYIVRM